MQLAGEGAELWLEVSDEVRPLITDRSVAIIGAISLLGEGAIDISPAAAGTSIPDWGYVPSGEAPNSIAALSASAGTGLAETNRLLADIGRARARSASCVTDDTAYREMEALVRSATRVTDAVERGRGSLGRLVQRSGGLQRAGGGDGEPQRHHRPASRPARAASARCSTIRRWPGRCRPRSANLEGITGRLAKGEGTAGKLLTDEALYARLTALTTRLDDLSLALQSGRGTAGRLLQDDVLYDNMNASVAELRQLALGHPEGPEEVSERQGQPVLTTTPGQEGVCRETASGGSVMLAFMLGAMAGAAVALLFAPAAGEETREYLGKRAREGRDRARDAARDAADHGREFYQRQRDSVTTAIERGREAFQQAREEGRNA